MEKIVTSPGNRGTLSGYSGGGRVMTTIVMVVLLMTKIVVVILVMTEIVVVVLVVDGYRL